jgi:Protein of unknown function (DUF1592)/Protein of unknown function (DUF1588)/Protein of unknown function (DUF1595)/Protein of unknown function (DUF1585)/Protein of unknown function (DUF1587)
MVGVLLLLLVGVAHGATSPERVAVVAAFDQHVKPLFATYCLDCHGLKKVKGDTNLRFLTDGEIAMRDLPLVRHALGKLLSRDMPPSGEKQPSDAERQRAGQWLAALRRLSPPDPGTAPVRRLSKVEYANTLRDLFGVETAIADELPNDTVGAGFNSTIAPLLMEKYLLIADEVLDRVIRPDQMKLSWRAGQLDLLSEGKTDAGKADGAERQFSGPGQLSAILPAPVDGSYTVKIRAASEKLGKEPLRLAVRVGNQVLGELKITAPLKNPATYTLTIKLSAGRAPVSFIVINPVVQPEAQPEAPKTPPAARPPAKPGAPPKPTPPASVSDQPQKRTLWIDAIDITGPPAAVPTEVQKRLFVATPGKDLDKRAAARQIAEAFARRAFRRPASKAELDVLMQVFDLADGQDEVFAESVKLMLKGVLVSPQFLYLSADTSRGSPDEIVRLGDHQIAAKLSYLLWATMPDDELAALADQGKLKDASVLESQVRRLLADSRARAFFDGFGAQWLGLDRLAGMPIDEKKFPLMTAELRRSMYEEAALLFDCVLREDRSLFDLLEAEFTFMNGPLARIYGMENDVKGAQFRRVSMSDANRGGILTLPGVMAVTSMPSRTSPVKRGRFVLENILGQPTPNPPMNVPSLEQQDVPANATLNLRQRAERHRSDPACSGCHVVMDPIGFGLENFDAIGRWREKDDTGLSVDPTGELPGKITFQQPKDLKRIISARREEVTRALTHQMLAYALCRNLDGYDEVVVDDLTAALAKDGYRLQSLIVRVATSYPFLNRRVTR